MKAGTQAQALADGKAILQVLCSDVTRDDVIVFMSNGGFGGLQQKALAALRDLHGS
jgi:UDP-N-acetylmuramate-alanine ligase